MSIATGFKQVVLLSVVLLGAFALSCGPVEIRLSKAQGIKPVTGALSASYTGGTFACGDSIIGDTATQSYTVTTAPVLGGCLFTFDQDVEVLADADYKTIKEFTSLANTLNRVELEVRRLDFSDGDGKRFVIGERIHEIELWVNGQQVLNVDELGQLPMTVVLKGEALEVMKRAVKNRTRCTAHVVAKVVVRDAATGNGVRCDYDSQPTLVLSSSEL